MVTPGTTCHARFTIHLIIHTENWPESDPNKICERCRSCRAVCQASGKPEVQQKLIEALRKDNDLSVRLRQGQLICLQLISTVKTCIKPWRMAKNMEKHPKTRHSYQSWFHHIEIHIKPSHFNIKQSHIIYITHSYTKTWFGWYSYGWCLIVLFDIWYR